MKLGVDWRGPVIRRVPRRGALAVVGLVATCWVLAASEPAGAAIALVKAGTESSGTGSSITFSLGQSSVAGHLLVAEIADVNSGCSTDSFSAPAGWVKAAHSCRGTSGPIELWYYPNAPAGINFVTFNTGSSGANARAQISEWSGVATASPLDQIGTSNTGSSSASLTVTTTGAIATSSEVAITGFLTSSGMTSFSATGWATLVHDVSNGFDDDYKLSPTSGSTLTETATSSPSTTWGAVIATFKPPCAAGGLSMAAPSSVTLTGVTLNASNQTSTSSVVLAPDDERNTGAGWNITGTSTTFTTGSNSLATTATQVGSASVSAASGNCSLPTNSITYPTTLPAGATPPTAVKLYNAAANTGAGPTNVTLNLSTSVPANSRKGTYTSTWTFAIVSGP